MRACCYQGTPTLQCRVLSFQFDCSFLGESIPGRGHAVSLETALPARCRSFPCPTMPTPLGKVTLPSGAGTLGNECPFFFRRQTQRTLPPGALETAPLCGARSRDDQTDHQASCDSFGPDLGGLVRGYGHALRVFSAGKRPEASRVAQMVRATLSGARKRGCTSGSRGDKASSSGAAGGPPRPAMPSGTTWHTSLRRRRLSHPRRTCGTDRQNRACAEDQFPCTAGLCRKQIFGCFGAGRLAATHQNGVSAWYSGP